MHGHPAVAVHEIRCVEERQDLAHEGEVVGGGPFLRAVAAGEFCQPYLVPVALVQLLEVCIRHIITGSRHPFAQLDKGAADRTDCAKSIDGLAQAMVLLGVGSRAVALWTASGGLPPGAVDAAGGNSSWSAAVGGGGTELPLAAA